MTEKLQKNVIHAQKKDRQNLALNWAKTAIKK